MKRNYGSSNCGPDSWRATPLYSAIAEIFARGWLMFGAATCGIVGGAPVLAATEHTSTWDQDLAFGDSIVFSAPAARGLATGPNQVTAAGDNLIRLTNTSRFQLGVAVWANKKGSVTATNGITIETSGNSISGVMAGDGFGGIPQETQDFEGTVTLRNATIVTNGNSSTAAVAYGYRARVDISSSTIETRGDGGGLGAATLSSAGVAAGGGGTATVEDSTVATLGAGAPGLLMLGSGSSSTASLEAKRTRVQTFGDGSPGFFASFRLPNYGAVDDVDITTAGVNSSGIRAEDGAIVIREGGLRVQTTGNTSVGIQAQGASGLVNGPGKITVTTTGGAAPAASSERSALFESKTSGSSFQTVGDGSVALRVLNGGQAKLSGATLDTAGRAAYGIESSGVDPATAIGGSGEVMGGSVTTRGQESYAAYVHDASSLTLGDGIVVETQNDNSSALVAGQSGSASAGNLAISNASVTTRGAGAAGMVAAGGGSLVASSAVAVETYGAGAPGIQTMGGAGAGGTVDIAESTVHTYGVNSAGVLSQGGRITIGPNVKVETSGDRSSVVVLDGTGASAPKFGPGFVGHSHGIDSHGLSLRGGARYELGLGNDMLPLANLTLGGAGSAVIHAQDAGSVLTVGTGVDLSVASLGAQGVGAKAENGGSIVFLSGARTGGLPIIATGTTGLASLVFQEGSDASGSAASLDAGGSLDISSRTTKFRLGSLEGAAGLVHLGSNELEVGGNNASTTYGGVIDGSGMIRKVGEGTFTLRGNQVFQYGGGTEIDNGVLRLTNISSPNTFSQRFVLNGGWLDLSDGPLSTLSPERSWDKLQIVQGTSTNGGVIGSSDKLVYTVASGQEQVVGYQLGGATAAQQGVFVEKSGGGTLELTGINNYAGNTRVLGGTLRIRRDENLGNTMLGREVVLDGGGLDVQGDVAGSRRTIELRQAATINVGDAYTASWAGALQSDGCNCTLTKTGGGVLSLGEATRVGGLALQGGSTRIYGGTIGGAASAISAGQGNSSLMLRSSQVTGSGTAATVSGKANFNLQASASRVNGLMTTRDSGSLLDARFSDGSIFTGSTAQGEGSTLNLSLDDSETQWNVDHDSQVHNLVNRGSISFLPGEAGPRSLVVSGDYTGGGRLGLNTVLNSGGPIMNQSSDRLLVRGDVSGDPTYLNVRPSGSGANTNINNSHRSIASEGISVVQVAGASSSEAFQLSNNGKPYVSAPGSAFQYRLFAYGPQSKYGLADPSQNLIPGAQAAWDYRLQTAYETESGEIIPGVPDVVDKPPVRRALLPQVPSYGIVGPALQRYDYFVAQSLQDGLSEALRGGGAARAQSEVFARAVGETVGYQSNLSWQDYGYNFDQTNRAMQFGTTWRVARNQSQDLRLGAAITLGSLSASPSSDPGSRVTSDAQSLSLLTQWSGSNGWYAGAVATGTRYRGEVRANGERAGRVQATSLSLSLDVGKQFLLPNGMEVTPNVRLIGQSVKPDSLVDKEAGGVSFNSDQIYTAQAGVRVAMPLKHTLSWKPYATAGLSQSWGAASQVAVAQDATVGGGKVGSSVFVGVGATGQLTKSLSLFGQVTRQARIGSGGFNGTSGTIGLRYEF